MNSALKWLAVLLAPLVAACSSTSGLTKKDRYIPASDRSAMARSVGATEDRPVYTKKKPMAQLCSYSPSTSGRSGLLDALEESCEPGCAVEGSNLPAESPIRMGKNRPPTPALKFPVPSGCLSSPFGYRHGVFHSGVDITAPAGTPIEACADGKVLFAGTRKAYRHYGKSVIIYHGNGVSTYYAHTSAVLVRPEQRIRKGQVIARVGSTGRATCPHLHLEVQVGNRLYNPMSCFSDQAILGVKVARNFSNKPACPILARRRFANPVSMQR